MYVTGGRFAIKRSGARVRRRQRGDNNVTGTPMGIAG